MQDNDMNRNEQTATEDASIGRRKLIKALGATGGVLAASTLSVRWQKPFIELSMLASANATTTTTTTDYDHNHQDIAVVEKKLTDSGGNEGETRVLLADGQVEKLQNADTTPLAISEAGLFQGGNEGLMWMEALTENNGENFVLVIYSRIDPEAPRMVRAPVSDYPSQPAGESIALQDGESVRFDIETFDKKTVYEIELLVYRKGTKTVTSGAVDTSKNGTSDTSVGYVELHRLVKVTKS